MLGVSEENECFEVLAIELGDREKTDLWESVFRNPWQHGRLHEAVELGVMDGPTGRAELCGRYFPRAPTQRCQKHAKANAWRRLRQREREEFSTDLNKIFHAPRESQARAAFAELKAKWGQWFPSAVAVIEKDFDALPCFFQFDPTCCTVLRTTHPMERLNKELKGRTRAMEVTAGEISTYRCLVCVAQTMEYRWSFHPLSQWTFIYTQIAVCPENAAQPGRGRVV